MSLDSLIQKIPELKRIEELNIEGIQKSSHKDLYDEVIKLHTTAISLSKDLISKVEQRREAVPGQLYDYEAWSLTNLAYVIRRGKSDKQAALKLLEEGLEVTKDNSTFVGRARLYEEKGLVLRYNGATVDEIKEALSFTEKSFELYEKAAQAPEEEIFNEAEIKSKINRAKQVWAPATAELLALRASLDDQEKVFYQEKSIKYATEALNSRLEDGETGFNLIDAYHTLAAAQTESTADNPKMYEQAKENLNNARELAEVLPDDGLDKPLHRTVFDFREAWLELKHNPNERKRIQEPLDRFLATYKKTLDKGVIDALEKYVSKLIEHVKTSYDVELKQYQLLSKDN